MVQLVIYTALLLVARVSAEHVQEVSNVQTVPVRVGQEQPSHMVGHTSAVESGFEAGPMQSMAPHYYSPAGMIHVVGEQQSQTSGSFKPAAGGPGGQASGPVTVRHYAAAGPSPVSGPTVTEQYGQPESAAIPPNYKPFGSWGLYIGGNPADGYYTNYYKALSSSVADKQQQQQAGSTDQAATSAVAPVGAGRVSPAGPQTFVGQTSGFGASGVAPTMKQGPFYPTGQAVNYQDQTYQGYPYGEYYTPADLNSGSRVTVQSMPSVYGSGSTGASASGSPSSASFYGEQPPASPSVAAMYFAADYAHATKKAAPSFGTKDAQAPLSPVKGYHQAQQRAFYAAQQQAYQQQAYQQQQQQQQAPPQPPAFGPAPAFAAYYNQQQQQQQQPQQAGPNYQQSGAPAPQVVAYPVPVGSQMVGSQPGVEGAFQPYGVHAFTRYAVKPTVVNNDQNAYAYNTGVHSAPASQFPVYKQFFGYQQPMSFYGYPVSQLHYSNGFVGSAMHGAAQANNQSPVSAGQQQQQSQASFANGAQSQAPAPAPAPAPAAAPAPPAPAPVADPAQGGATVVVVEHSGPVPAGQAHSPVGMFEAASSEKSETSEAQKETQVTEKKQKVQPQQQQQQQQKNN